MSISKKSKTIRVVAGLLGFAMAFSLSFGVVTPSASAATIEELTAQINSLLSTIASLQAQLSGMQGGSSSVGAYVFAANLTVGSKGQDVMNLQKVLNMSADTQVASGGSAGSPGNETSFFGPATKAAVIKFQIKNGISPVAGYVGPITRAKLNSMGGTVVVPPGVTPPPAPAGTGLTVSSPTQPAGSLAPQSAARVPFTKITVTAGSDGDVILNSVTVQRGGLAQDAVFGGIVLLNENGLQLGIAKTLNSNHQAVIGEAVTIPRGTSKTFTVAGNMAASLSAYAGQVANISVVGVNTAAVVSGSLPIVGASHTINSSLSIGSVTTERASLQPTTAVNKEVGTTGFTFSQFKVTAGSVENVRVHSVRWNQASSAGSADLANVVTVVSGVEYPTTISADGKYYSTVFPGGLLIEKGLFKEISIKADVAGGSGRTINFGVEKTTDLYIIGETYGYGITPPSTGTGFTSGTIWYPAQTITVANGSITVEKALAVPAQNIAPNLGNQVLGGYTVEIKGEPITVASHVFSFATTGTKTAGSSAQITQVTIVDENGSVIAGPVDEVDTTGDVTFTDTVLYPIGKKTYTFKGKVGPGFGADGTVILSTTPSTNWTTVTGQVTGKTITPSSAAVTMSTITVKSAALTISVSSNPAAQTIVAGAQDFIFANVLLDATASGEDMTMSSVPLDYELVTGSTDLTSCNLFNGSTQLTSGTNTVNPSGDDNSLNFTLDSTLTIPKGTVTTLTVKCNIPSSITSGAHSFGYNSASTPTITGKTSGQSVTPTENTGAGQTITETTGGTIAVALDSSSPSYSIAAAGTAGNVASVLRFTTTNEAIKLTEVALVLTQVAGNASSSPDDVTKVTLWDGVTKVGESIFTGGSYYASTTIGSCAGCSDFIVPKDADKVMTVKVDLGEQGISQVGTPGAFIRVDWDGGNNGAPNNIGGVKGVGQSSGTTISANGTDTASSGFRVFKSYPTVEIVPLSDTKLVAGRRDLFKFKVTASTKGDVGIHRLSFTIATSSATQQIDMIDALNVYGFTDSAYSTPVSGVQTDGALGYVNKDLTLAWASASSILRIHAETTGNASTTLVIPAGTTRYFTLRGDVTLAGTTYSVSSALQGDQKFESGVSPIPHKVAGASTSYLSSTTYFLTVSNVASDFIWRPYSTTTTNSAATLDYDDFANGYGVPGLPSTNTNSQILSN